MKKTLVYISELTLFFLGIFLIISCGDNSQKTENLASAKEKADESFRNALQDNLSDVATANETAEQELKRAEEERQAEEERIRNSKKVYNVYISYANFGIEDATTDNGDIEIWGRGATRTEARLVDYVPTGKVYILDYVDYKKSNSNVIFSECIGVGRPGHYHDKNWYFGKQKELIVVRGGNYFSMILDPCRDGEIKYTIGFIVKDESEVW